MYTIASTERLDTMADPLGTSAAFGQLADPLGMRAYRRIATTDPLGTRALIKSLGQTDGPLKAISRGIPDPLGSRAVAQSLGQLDDHLKTIARGRSITQTPDPLGTKALLKSCGQLDNSLKAIARVTPDPLRSREVAHSFGQIDDHLKTIARGSSIKQTPDPLGTKAFLESCGQLDNPLKAIAPVGQIDDHLKTIIRGSIITQTLDPSLKRVSLKGTQESSFSHQADSYGVISQGLRIAKIVDPFVDTYRMPPDLRTEPIGVDIERAVRAAQRSLESKTKDEPAAPVAQLINEHLVKICKSIDDNSKVNGRRFEGFMEEIASKTETMNSLIAAGNQIKTQDVLDKRNRQAARKGRSWHEHIRDEPASWIGIVVALAAAIVSAIISLCRGT